MHLVPRPFQYPVAEFGGILVDGDGADGQAAMADLAPVAGHVHPAEIIRRIARPACLGGNESLVPDALHQRGTDIWREGVVKPVIGDGGGEIDFRDIQEMIGIPASEAADGAGEAFRLHEEAVFSRHSPGIRDKQHLPYRLAANLVHFLAGIQLELGIGLTGNHFALGENRLVNLLPPLIRADIAHQILFPALRQKQPRVGRKRKSLQGHKQRGYDGDESHQYNGFSFTVKR